MAPSFVRTMRERGLPAEPPTENPYEVAKSQYDGLREYASKVMDIAREVDDANKVLTAENNSLSRENERLAAEVTRLSRENRLVSAFGQSLRTRAVMLQEQMEAFVREAMQEAVQEAQKPVPKSETVEAELSRVHRAAQAQQPRETFRNGGLKPPANAFG